MHTESLLLEFMARINDALKSDASETAKLKAVYRAKQWAEDEYAKVISEGSFDLSDTEERK